MIILQHAETDSSFCLMSIGAKYIAFIYWLKVYALYNAASSAAPLNTSDPLLLECQEIISLMREAWKDGFSYKYVFAEKKNKSWIQGNHTQHKPL